MTVNSQGMLKAGDRMNQNLWLELAAAKLLEAYKGWIACGWSHEDAKAEALRTSCAGPGARAIFEKAATLIQDEPQAN